MNKYRITYRFTACKARNPNNNKVRDCKSRTTKKYIFLSLVFFVLLSCNKIEKPNNNEAYNLNAPINDLHLMVKNGVLIHIELMDLDTYKALVIEFTNENILEFVDNDTIILIYSLDCRKDNNGYKGCLKIKDYNIALYDLNNIGNQFYDTNRLINIPLDLLGCNDNDTIDALVLKVQNGEIVEWRTKFIDP
ncbi:MAG: hypothetical protein ACK5MH_01420 [Bacteroidales bacterium]